MRPKANPSSKALRRATIKVRVLPRAKHNEIIEILEDNTVKIRLTAPPVEGRANQALIKFLANFLGVSKSKIEILSGANIRNKMLSVHGMDSNQILEKIHVELKD